MMMTTQSAFWLHVFPSNFMFDVVQYIPIEDLCHWLASIMSTRKSFMTFIDENMDKFWQDRQWHTSWNQLESIFLRYPILFCHIKKLPNSFSLLVRFDLPLALEMELKPNRACTCWSFVANVRQLDVELRNQKSNGLFHLLDEQSRVKWLTIRGEENVLKSIHKKVHNKHLQELTLIFKETSARFPNLPLYYGKNGFSLVEIISCPKLKILKVNDMVFIRKMDGLFCETSDMLQVRNAINCLVPYFDIKFPMEELNEQTFRLPLEFVMELFPYVKRLTLVTFFNLTNPRVLKHQDRMASINEVTIICNNTSNRGWVTIAQMYLKSKFPNMNVNIEYTVHRVYSLLDEWLNDVHKNMNSLIETGFDFEQLFSLLGRNDRLYKLRQVFDNQFIKWGRWIVLLSEKEEEFKNVVDQYCAVVEEENSLVRRANNVLDEIKMKIQYYYSLHTKYVYNNPKVCNGMNELVKEMECHIEEMGLNPSILHSKQRRPEVLEEELAQKRTKPNNQTDEQSTLNHFDD